MARKGLSKNLRVTESEKLISNTVDLDSEAENMIVVVGVYSVLVQMSLQGITYL